MTPQARHTLTFTLTGAAAGLAIAVVHAGLKLSHLSSGFGSVLLDLQGLSEELLRPEHMVLHGLSIALLAVAFGIAGSLVSRAAEPRRTRAIWGGWLGAIIGLLVGAIAALVLLGTGPEISTGSSLPLELQDLLRWKPLDNMSRVGGGAVYFVTGGGVLGALLFGAGLFLWGALTRGRKAAHGRGRLPAVS